MSEARRAEAPSQSDVVAANLASAERSARRSVGPTKHDPTPGDERDVAHAALRDALVEGVVFCIETRGDYASGVQLLEDAVPAAARERFAIEIVRALAERTVDWAAHFALALPLGAARYAAIDIAAEAFARRDAGQALQWATGLPTGATRSIALERIVGELANADFASATTALDALPPSLARDDAACSLAAHWTRRDAASALEWAKGFPDGPLKPRIIATVGFELAQTDPAAAIRFAENITSSADRALLLASLRWSQPTERRDFQSNPTPK